MNASQSLSPLVLELLFKIIDVLSFAMSLPMKTGTNKILRYLWISVWIPLTQQMHKFHNMLCSMLTISQSRTMMNF